MARNFLRKTFVILLLLVTACSTIEQTSSLLHITLQLGTTHQAVYGGFYAADQNGDYAREGLAVSFVEGTPTTDTVAPLLDGSAQFGVIGSSAIISQRAAGQPIRAVATILRRDPVVFFNLTDSGIARLQDFVGKKALVAPILRPRLYAMLAKAGIDRNQVTLVDTGDYTDLYTGKIDIASGLITNTVLKVQQSGHPVNIIYPDDYGVHFYSTAIFASDDYIAAHADVVTRFLRATFNGWTYAVENPQSVGQLVIHYNPKADADFESASMVASLPYVNTGEDHIGWMKPEIWDGMLQTMRLEGEVTTPLDIKDVYTMQFLQQIYGEPQS